MDPFLALNGHQARSDQCRFRGNSGHRQAVSDLGSRHLAAGSRLRLRACPCKSGCNRDAALMSDALTVAGFLDRGRQTGLATGWRATATVSVIVLVPVASRLDTPTGSR